MHQIENKNMSKIKINANQNGATGIKGKKIDGEQLKKAVDTAIICCLKTIDWLYFLKYCQY